MFPITSRVMFAGSTPTAAPMVVTAMATLVKIVAPR
jgi:hypothetical protein